MLYKRVVFKSFAIFTGKHLYHRFFLNKCAGLGLELYLKKTLWHRCFLVTFAEIFNNTFCTVHLQPVASEGKFVERLHMTLMKFMSVIRLPFNAKIDAYDDN